MDVVQPNSSCPKCHAVVPASAYFCPNCGKVIRAKPLSTTILKQTVIYLVSLLIPPFGYWYGWRYLRQPDHRSKLIGLVATVLTTVATVATIWATKAALDEAYRAINSINSLTF